MIWSYLKLDILTNLRQKIYLLLSIAFPLIFFLLFTSLNQLPKAQENEIYIESLISMTVFSLTSFALMTFPIELVQDEQSGWQRRILTTPFSPVQYFSAKVLKIMLLYATTIIVLFTVGGLIKGIHMSFHNWLIIGLLLWMGASLFLTIGLLLAQITNVQKASSIGNLLYILLAISGGLWFPIQLFPHWLKNIAYLTPTYHLKNLGIAYYQNHEFNFQSFGVLVLYSILFTIVALAIQRKRDLI